MSLQRVRRAISFLRKKAGLEDHLSEVSLVTDGQSIFNISRDEGAMLDALKEGQLAFFLAIDDVARNVDTRSSGYLYDRDEFVAALRGVESDLEQELDPAARRRAEAGR